MNRVKVKTREQVKSVKVLDWAAVAGERMKNAYIRTKEKAVRNREDRNNTPNGYAEDRVQEYARSMARNAARTARFGGKAIRQKGHVLFQQYGEDRDEAPYYEGNSGTGGTIPPTKYDFTVPKGPVYKEVDFGRDVPPSPRLRLAAQKQQYQRYFYRRIKKAPPLDGLGLPESLASPGLLESPGVSPYAPTPNLVTERGREFAKKQAAKRSKIAREIKTKETLTTIRQKDGLGDFLPKTALEISSEIIVQGYDGTKEIVPEVINGLSVPSPVKMTVQKRAASQTAFTGGENLRQTVFRLVIKTSKHDGKATVQAVQRAAEASKKAVLLAERAEKISQFAAKSAAVAAKRAAKISAAAIKAILFSAKTLIAAIAGGGGTAVLAVVVICLIGQLVCSSFGIFFAGEDSGTGQTIASAVSEINQEFEDKLAEIQASVDYDILDLSGSCAPWREVLVLYAVKTTTDPNNGQEVAIMDDEKKALLQNVFWKMNQISHSVSVREYEVSSTTTDDEGNEVETTESETEVTLHITISHKTTDEMANSYHFDSDQKEQLDFLLSPENNDLWNALLLGAGVSASGGNGGDIVSVALSQVGNVGGEPYWRWYGFNSRVEWCACFVSWCANESGVHIPKFSRCVDGVAWFRGQGLWQNGRYSPQPGDIIFFDWDNGGGQDGIPDHVGIVEKVEGGTVYTIEGNSIGDSCRQNQYAVGNHLIYGYGEIS